MRLDVEQDITTGKRLKLTAVFEMAYSRRTMAHIKDGRQLADHASLLYAVHGCLVLAEMISSDTVLPRAFELPETDGVVSGRELWQPLGGATNYEIRSISMASPFVIEIVQSSAAIVGAVGVLLSIFRKTHKYLNSEVKLDNIEVQRQRLHLQMTQRLMEQAIHELPPVGMFESSVRTECFAISNLTVSEDDEDRELEVE